LARSASNASSSSTTSASTPLSVDGSVLGTFGAPVAARSSSSTDKSPLGDLQRQSSALENQVADTSGGESAAADEKVSSHILVLQMCS